MNSYNFIYGEDNLPHRAKAVYIYLRDRSNKEGVCWPGIPDKHPHSEGIPYNGNSQVPDLPSFPCLYILPLQIGKPYPDR